MHLQVLHYDSVLLFGEYSGLKVEQLMNNPVTRNYLRWLYFNASHVDFTIDLLEDLKIDQFLFKPGKDPACYQLSYRIAS